VHRYDPERGEPLTTEAAVEPSDTYAQHKIAAEALVRDGGVPYTILRMSSVWLDRSPNAQNLRLMYDIPLDTRMETAHPDDLALAFARAPAVDELVGRTLFVGGGPSCQTTYRQLYSRIFAASGLSELPDAAFTQRPFIGDWLDTAESQRLLNYQHHSLEQLIAARRAGRITRAATRLLSPLIQRWMLSHSSHWSAAARQ